MLYFSEVINTGNIRYSYFKYGMYMPKRSSIALYIRITYLTLLVHICSPVNQHLGSISVAILTSSMEWSFHYLYKFIDYIIDYRGEGLKTHT